MRVCKNFRRDTETCLSGCHGYVLCDDDGLKELVHVARGNTCPYDSDDPDTMADCPGYRA